MNKASVFLKFTIMFLLLASFVFAEDKVWIEAPSVVRSHEPFQIKLHIQDSTIEKYATSAHFRYEKGLQYIDHETKVSMPYEIDPTKDLIVFDAYASYRDDEYSDNEIEITFAFLSDYETISKHFDIDYSNHIQFANVTKKIKVIPSIVSADYPKPDSCTAEEITNPMGYLQFSCRSDEDHPQFFSVSGTAKKYSCLTPLDTVVGCSFVDKEKLGTTEESGNVISRYEGGGNTVYKFSTTFQEYYVWREDPDDPDEPKKHQVYFSCYYSDLDGAVHTEGDMIKAMWLEKDDVQSQEAKFENEFKAFASSISASGSGSGPDKKSDYWNIFAGEQPKTEDTYVYGYITDADKNAMPYMGVYVKVDGEKYFGRTDLNGNYEIMLEDVKFKDDNVEAMLYLNFSYYRDGKNYYVLAYYKSGSYKYVDLYRKLELKQGENTQYNWILDDKEDRDLFTNLGTYANIKNIASIYFHTHEAVDFALTQLNADIDYKLPIFVFIGKDDKNTLYSPVDASIYIAKSDMSYHSSNRPKNREYHEFGHHLMFSTYKGWTNTPNLQQSVNHDGFLNPDTADSFDEGFAEFYAMAIGNFLNQPKKDEYAGFGSLENNYKPWSAKGYYEEFAVASFLWDVLDKENEAGDSVTLSMDDIWKVIKVRRTNFYDYIVAFKENHPKLANDFNELAKLHGFFADTTVGNGKFDKKFEAYRDANNNGKLDNDELWFDLGCNKSKCNIEYKKGESIGFAANYQRLTRKQAVKLENAYLKVDPNGPRYYTISVKYNSGDLSDYSYDIERFGDKLYVSPLPDDVDAIIKIEPDTQDFTYKSAYTATSQEINELIFSNEKEHFTEHDFGLKSLGTKNDPIYLEDYEPSITTDEGKNEKIAPKIAASDEDGLLGAIAGFLRFIFIIAAIIAILALLVFTASKASKKSNKSYDKPDKRNIHKAAAVDKAEDVGKTGKAEKDSKIDKSHEIKKKASDLYKKTEHTAKEAYKKSRPHIVKASKTSAAFAKESANKAKEDIKDMIALINEAGKPKKDKDHKK